MKSIVALALVAGFLCAASPKDEEKVDVNKLQGAWKALTFKEGDQPQQKEGAAKYVLVFEGDHYHLMIGDKSMMEGTFKVHPSKSPKQIDLKVTKQAENSLVGQTSLGVYELDQDQLKWCSARPGDGHRPADFKTDGKEYLLVLFERSRN